MVRDLRAHDVPRTSSAVAFLSIWVCFSHTYPAVEPAKAYATSSLFQNDLIPIHERFDVLKRRLAFGRVTDEGTVVVIFGAIVEVPAQGVAEDTQAGCAAEVVWQRGLEGVDIGALGGVHHFDNGCFVDPAQPLVLRNPLFLRVD